MFLLTGKQSGNEKVYIDTVYDLSYPDNSSVDISDGVVVEVFLPHPDVLKVKSFLWCVDPITKRQFFEMVDRPPTSDEKFIELEKETLELKNKQNLMHQENQLLQAQNNVLSERADFIEDVVAEMAAQVYQ